MKEPLAVFKPLMTNAIKWFDFNNKNVDVHLELNGC